MKEDTPDPIEKIVTGFQQEDEAIQDTINDLSELGYDVGRFVSNLEAKVFELSDANRLSWMKKGEAIQQKLDHSLKQISSWKEKSVESIERAFQKAIDSSSINSTNPKFQAAFRNAKELTIENKATLLDELRALDELNASTDKNPSNESST